MRITGNRVAHCHFETAPSSAMRLEGNDIGKRALVLGNGDLNALLWERNGALCLRVTKNDLWDARIDTSEDPPLLKMDLKDRTGSGGTGAPPSWHKHPYPLLRDAAEFYANVLAQCRDGELGPSYNPEQGPFGTFNNPVDIAYFRFLFTAAIDAAHLLDRDARLVERWQRQRARVPDYETTPLDGAPIVANWKGADVNSVEIHNVVVPTVPIFPAGQITWFSPPEEKARFERTLRWIKFRDENSHIMVNVQRARLSLPEAYTKSREHFGRLLTPNGLFAEWPGHGFYLAESWAFAGLTGDLLLQSVDGIIRVFPAWPRDQDAKFTDLRAQGGFLVSAEQKAGKVTSLSIRSTVGGRLRVLNPWTGAIDQRETKPGERLAIQP